MCFRSPASSISSRPSTLAPPSSWVPLTNALSARLPHPVAQNCTKMDRPTLWYKGQFLLEKEPSADPADLGYKLTQAAEEAQKAVGASLTPCYCPSLRLSLTQKWEMLIANRPPMKNITEDWLATRRNKPPVLLYGWPFKRGYFLEYAKRHKLSVRLSEQTLQRLGCPTENFNFGDMTEEHYQDESLLRILHSAAEHASLRHLRDSTGIRFQIGRPLSLEWNSILYVWTNYNMRERYLCDGLAITGRFEQSKPFLDKAMNECLPEATKTELRWWWSLSDNAVVRSPHGPR